jgi:N-acyl homoserine lactone hydrolase
MKIQVPSYLIEHKRGLVMFDTGLDPAAADDPERYYPTLHRSMNLQFLQEQRTDRQIQDLGYKLSDVTHVVASHLHLDHVGALHLFKEAQIFVGDGELQYAMWPHPTHLHLYQREALDRMRNYSWRQLHGTDFDLFGDGSLVLLSTPGHTPGELSLLVRLPNRTIILTGDTVHTREALERELTFPMDLDSRLARRSIQRLKLLRDSLGADVWIAHDPEDWAETKRAPYCYE